MNSQIEAVADHDNFCKDIEMVKQICTERSREQQSRVDSGRRRARDPNSRGPHGRSRVPAPQHDHPSYPAVSGKLGSNLFQKQEAWGVNERRGQGEHNAPRVFDEMAQSKQVLGWGSYLRRRFAGADEPFRSPQFSGCWVDRSVSTDGFGIGI